VWVNAHRPHFITVMPPGARNRKPAGASNRRKHEVQLSSILPILAPALA
jgi:hypothetical protein